MTPEGRVKKKVKDLFETFPGQLYYHMPVQNGMGRPSLDFIGCVKGRFFAVETKAPGGQVTARQKLTMGDMKSAGGKVFVVQTQDDLDDLKHWLYEQI